MYPVEEWLFIADRGLGGHQYHAKLYLMPGAKSRLLLQMNMLEHITQLSTFVAKRGCHDKDT